MKAGGFSQEDASPLRIPPEEKFQDLYGGTTVEAGGKIVMKEGEILDKKWYRKKLVRIKKRFRLTNIPSSVMVLL